MILNGECGAFNPILLECFMEIEGDLGLELEEKTCLWAESVIQRRKATRRGGFSYGWEKFSFGAGPS